MSTWRRVDTPTDRLTCPHSVIVVPGIDISHPRDWSAKSIPWLKVLMSSLSPKAQSWAFEYSVDRSKHLITQLNELASALLHQIIQRIESDEKVHNVTADCTALVDQLHSKVLSSHR